MRGLHVLADPAEEQRAARAAGRVVLPRAHLRPPGLPSVAHRGVEAVHVERGRAHGIRVPAGAGVARHPVGELDRVEHRHELVVLPHRVVRHRLAGSAHDETVAVDLHRQLPRVGELHGRRAGRPAAQVDQTGDVPHGRVAVRLVVGEPHLEGDAPFQAGVHRVLGPVQRASVQVEGERAPAPRRRAREAAEHLGGRVTHAHSAAPRLGPGPRGFRTPARTVPRPRGVRDRTGRRRERPAARCGILLCTCSGVGETPSRR